MNVLSFLGDPKQYIPSSFFEDAGLDKPLQTTRGAAFIAFGAIVVAAITASISLFVVEITTVTTTSSIVIESAPAAGMDCSPLKSTDYAEPFPYVFLGHEVDSGVVEENIFTLKFIGVNQMCEVAKENACDDYYDYLYDVNGSLSLDCFNAGVFICANKRAKLALSSNKLTLWTLIRLF